MEKNTQAPKAIPATNSPAPATNSPAPAAEANHIPRGFTVDLGKAKANWGKDFSSVSDLFTTSIDFPGGKISTPSHMLGMQEQDLRILPYDDSRGIAQHHLAVHVRNGEIALSFKHHCPHPDNNPLEALKFQTTHVQIAVGVAGGVLTVNNPQNYTSGLFGDPSYPMIFVKPKFPEGISEQKTSMYLDNVRTWLVIANTFTEFPTNYNGGDPLKCITKQHLESLAYALIKALLGDQTALAWLKEPEQATYCAELAFLSLNLGIYFPLNKKFLGENFESVEQALSSKVFLEKNSNPHIDLVELRMAPEALNPIDQEITVHDHGTTFWSGLAVQPLHSADMVIEYIRRSVPRKRLGEEVASQVQGKILRKMRPTFYDVLALKDETERAAMDILVDRAVEITERIHPSYEAFRAAIEPTLMELAKFSQAHGMAYIPPHCFLLRATDFVADGTRNGLFGFTYVGHGVHQSLVREL